MSVRTLATSALRTQSKLARSRSPASEAMRLEKFDIVSTPPMDDFPIEDLPMDDLPIEDRSLKCTLWTC